MGEMEANLWKKRLWGLIEVGLPRTWGSHANCARPDEGKRLPRVAEERRDVNVAQAHNLRKKHALVSALPQ